MITFNVTDYLITDYLLTPKPKMKSKYKGVYEPNPRHYRKRNQYRGRIRIDGIVYDGYYATQREAAIAIDMILIRHKKEPVNILVKK
jgi:hypothetical protein